MTAGVYVTLALTTDNYPVETTWEITAQGESVLFSGVPYTDLNTIINQEWCVADGCYTFTTCLNQVVSSFNALTPPSTLSDWVVSLFLNL